MEEKSSCDVFVAASPVSERATTPTNIDDIIIRDSNTARSLDALDITSPPRWKRDP
jgi:hypothetical protein